MKRKVLVVLFTVLLGIFVVFGLSGCSTESYVVTFDTDGGSAVASQTVEEGQKVIRPENPKKMGFVFDGWYIDGEEWLFYGYTVTNNITLTAKWVESYTEGLQFQKIDNKEEYTVIGLGTASDLDIIIPMTYNNLPVTSISDNAFNADKNKQVNYLTSVFIPDSVTSIGSHAFRGCSNLTEISIPDSVTSIGSYAFRYCHNLIYNIYENGKYLGNNKNKYIALISVTNLAQNTYTIHQNTKFIYDSVFNSCLNLQKIIIPNNMISIGREAFWNCLRLTEITIPDSVTSIGEDAFYDCDSLTYNTYEKGNYLGNSKNKYLVLISVDDHTQRTYTIHQNTKFIYDSAFYSCSNLKEITIPDSVISIGYEAFSWCRRLSKITIPDSITSIGNNAFEYCFSLWELTIPESVTNIGRAAFYDCRCLTEVTLGNKVTEIGYNAFAKCRSLSIVYYTGTISEWTAIDIDDGNQNLKDATVYYYVEKETDVPTDGGKYWHYNPQGKVEIW